MRISVCIATFNGENYIVEQLESILNQLDENDEVIVSDDASTDNTINTINSIGDNRIKIFRNELEKGYSKNFENAISHAKGEYIFLSDQDDVWLPNKVIIMLEKLKSSDMVVSNACIVDENLNLIHPSHFMLRGVKKGFWINFIKTRYIGACMAFNKRILEKALPFPNKQFYCAHDYWLTLISEFYYKVKLENEPLLKYRRHRFNASTGGEFSTNSIIKIIMVRVYALICLLKVKFN